MHVSIKIIGVGILRRAEPAERGQGSCKIDIDNPVKSGRNLARATSHQIAMIQMVPFHSGINVSKIVKCADSSSH